MMIELLSANTIMGVVDPTALLFEQPLLKDSSERTKIPSMAWNNNNTNYASVATAAVGTDESDADNDVNPFIEEEDDEDDGHTMERNDDEEVDDDDDKKDLVDEDEKAEDDEDEREKEEEEEEDEEEEGHDEDDIVLGGTIETKAFALLTGVFFEDAEERQVLTIPITRLPATLGRSHDAKDPNFFGLGTRKVLSRQQAMIYYRDKLGGRFVQNPDSGKLKYVEPAEKEKKDVIGCRVDELPETGFFVIECLGKNRIFVDGERVDQGEIALLRSASSIKMNKYSLIFLLPEDAVTSKMKVSLASSSAAKRSSSSSNKKPTTAASSTTTTTTDKAPTSTSSTTTTPTPTTTPSNNRSGAALVESLEQTPVATLLKWFFEAIETNQWERRHQMIGGAITFHACKDAARSTKIHKIANTNNGVSRSEVMDWIRDSKRYGKWVSNVLNKMEVKSYQANVTKCLWKAGYRRNAPVGRFVRWNLPTAEELGPPEPLAEGEVDEDEGEEVVDVGVYVSILS
mmetsp:Transcript_10191/g.11645  ORF Transcript_10191/g.11645 Transcript_10191/m.11645 type:complete len:514 (-) Transcript_10191:118-1659(-)